MRSNRLRAAAGSAVSGYSIESGDKAPTAGRVGNGNSSSATYNSFSGQYDGWTNVLNSGSDDDGTQINFPSGLGFYLAGTNYTSAYLISNSYITFGTGHTQYSGFSGSSPSAPKIFVGAADNSYQRLYSKQNNSNTSAQHYIRIRFEGNSATSGTLGSPGIVWEITFFDPSLFGGNQLVEILVGIHGRTNSSNVNYIASASAAYTSGFNDIEDHSLVYEGNAAGTSWTVHKNYYVDGTDY